MFKPQWGIEREPIRVALSMVAVLGLGIVGKTVSCCMFCWLAITLQRVWAAPADDTGQISPLSAGWTCPADRQSLTRCSFYTTQQNNPLYIKNFVPLSDKLRLHYIIYSALDVFEERCTCVFGRRRDDDHPARISSDPRRVVVAPFPFDFDRHALNIAQ